MIFKIHYGLWYGGLVGIIPFMFNYAQEYSSATATQQGVLFTILPFVALIAKPIVCSLADKYGAHRQCLLICIYLAMLGYGSLVIYPFFPGWHLNNKASVWYLYCCAALLGNTSMCVVNSLGDSLAISSCTRKNINYGQYRLWGPIGFGVFGALWGACNQIPLLPKFTPGIITLIVLLSINSLLLTFWRDDEEFRVQSTVTSSTTTSITDSSINVQINSSTLIGASNDLDEPTSGGGGGGSGQPDDDDDDHDVCIQQSEQRHSDTNAIGQSGGGGGAGTNVQRIRLLWQLGCEQKSVIIYVFLFTFCGLLTGLHWQFFFPYVQSIASDQFYTIAALALPVQALGGELVFFMLSGKILKQLGASLTLVVCLFSFAMRYLLYAYLIPHVNIYWILPVELLQGPAFGLMYCVLTYQANIYSERVDEMVSSGTGITTSDVKFQLKLKSLHATLQGLLGASFEGLGLGLGAIVGGLTYDISPNLMWQFAGFSALLMGLICLIGELIVRVRGKQGLQNSGMPDIEQRT